MFENWIFDIIFRTISFFFRDTRSFNGRFKVVREDGFVGRS